MTTVPMPADEQVEVGGGDSTGAMGPPAFVFVDRWLTRLARGFSYFGGLALVFMAFLGTANVIASKTAGQSIANTNELIDYTLILVVYCAVASVQFGTGLLRVDIFSRKFPTRLNKGVDLVGCVLGACIYGFAGWEALSLLADHYSLKTKAAASVHSFAIWPFTVIYVVGTFFLAVALLWSIVRMAVVRDRRSEMIGPDTDPAIGEVAR
jgi:TRAP-type C4-dicarboxylate transport system permease small subunit